MTKEAKDKMGTGLIAYSADVKAWLAAEEDVEKKVQYQKLIEAIDIVLDSFKNNLETDEW